MSEVRFVNGRAVRIVRQCSSRTYAGQTEDVATIRCDAPAGHSGSHVNHEVRTQWRNEERDAWEWDLSVTGDNA